MSLSFVLLTTSYFAAAPLLAKAGQRTTARATASSFRIVDTATSTRQFPTVMGVEICAVGDTLIDAQLEKPFPKCFK